jgi:NTP pyrophosphatase (non-canonical NTP hydrolase)
MLAAVNQPSEKGSAHVDSLSALAQELRRFVDDRDWNQFHSPKNLTMALAVEVAELLEHFQWLTEEQSHSLSEEKLAEVRDEIGDTLIYLTRLADVLGIDPVEAARDKVKKNEEKYPAETVRGKALKYSEYGD